MQNNVMMDYSHTPNGIYKVRGSNKHMLTRMQTPAHSPTAGGKIWCNSLEHGLEMSYKDKPAITTNSTTALLGLNSEK